MSRDAPTLLYETPDGLARASLARDEATLGRDAACDVQIDHPTVSRRHARLFRSGDDGWRYEDLASRNGTHATSGAIDLIDGAALRLGRVRAWFFFEAPPADWTPDDEPPASQGKLVRCRCGNVGWAPAYTAGLTVQCKACGGQIVVGDDREPTHSVTQPAVATCPGCRTVVGESDAGHSCPECGVRMHVECYHELGGCATYGCSGVNELRRDLQSTAQETPAIATTPAMTSVVTRRERWPIVTWTLVGLVTFGVPAFAWAIVAFVRKRNRSAAVALAGGAIGAAASFVIWSFALNDGVWPW